MAFRCCPTVCSLLIITTIVFVGAAAGAHLTEQDDLIYAYTASSSVPSDCEVAVVGAGWGGIYFAWRYVPSCGPAHPGIVMSMVLGRAAACVVGWKSSLSH